KEKGHVLPVCGEMIISLTDPRNPSKNNKPERGPEIMQRYYLFIISELWYDVLPGSDEDDTNYPKNTADKYTLWSYDPEAILPPPSYKTDLQEFYEADLKAAMLHPALTGLDGILGTDKGAINEQIAETNWDVDQNLRDKG